MATLGLLLRGGKEVLLGRKIRKGADIGERTINGPGGKRTPEQTMLDCLSAELLDEVGITINQESAELVAVITFCNGDESEWEVHVYLITDFSGEPHDTAEMVAHEGRWWYPVNELPIEDMLSSDGIWMPIALRGRKFTAQVWQNKDGRELEGIALAFS